MNLWVNSIHKKTPLNHSAVLIWNLDLASTRSNIEVSENEFGLMSMMLAIKVFIVMGMIWSEINIARKLSLAWQVVALVLSAILPFFFPQIGNLVITRRAIKVRYCTFCKNHCDITNQVVDKRFS